MSGRAPTLVARSRTYSQACGLSFAVMASSIASSGPTALPVLGCPAKNLRLQPKQAQRSIPFELSMKHRYPLRMPVPGRILSPLHRVSLGAGQPRGRRLISLGGYQTTQLAGTTRKPNMMMVMMMVMGRMTMTMTVMVW